MGQASTGAAAEIATRLGPKDDGIGGEGPDALELTVPYVTLPERRPGHVPAVWVSKPSPPEPEPQKPAQLRLVRPLPTAAAERIREMGEASISARGGVQAALQYYAHLGEPPGRWAGERAARLSLAGPVTKSEFEAALKGIDPKTGERLAAAGLGIQTAPTARAQIFGALQAMNQPAAMPGFAVNLRQRDWELGRV